MKIFKSVALLSISLFALGAFLSPARAQTSATILPISSAPIKATASVSIYNAKIVSQDGSKVKIAFDLFNDGQTQPQIQYSVSLMKKATGGNLREDEKVYNEILSLGEKQTLHKEVEYDAPAYLNGTWQLWVMASNKSGLLLGLTIAGNVALTGNGEYVAIDPASCYLTVSGEVNKNYSAEQGVDVSTQENLIGHCGVKNNFKKEVTVSSFFETYWRNLYGKLLSSEGKEPFALKAGEKKQISFDIPTVKQPQAYDVVLMLKNSAGEIISNKIIFHYIIRGASATIQNVQMDKDYYAKGDNAKLSLRWTPSADIFVGSRLGDGSILAGVNAGVVLKDSVGADCATPLSKYIDDANQGSVIEIPVTNNCKNPAATVILKDDNGNVLDQSVFSVETKSKIPEAVNLGNDKQPSGYKNLMYAVIVVLVALLAIVFMFLKKKKVGGQIPPTIILLLIFCGVFLFSSNAMATTWSASAHWVESQTISFTVNINLAAQLDTVIYAPGSTITFYGQESGGYCSNGDTSGNMLAIPSWNGNLYQQPIVYGDPNRNTGGVTRTGTAYFTAPTTPGTYIIYVRGGTNGQTACYYGTFAQGNCAYDYPIYFTVASMPTSSLSASPTSIAQNGNTTLTWTSSSPNGLATGCWGYGRHNDDGTAVSAFPDAYLAPSGSQTIALDRSATFYLSCWDGLSQSATLKSASVAVTYCGDGIKNGAEACDLGDATHGNGNGTCPKTCSATCTSNGACCTPLPFKSGSVSTASVVAGGNFTINCDYGSAGNTFINAVPGSGTCSATGWNGTNRVFSCTAGNTPGTFSNTCQLSGGSYCSSNDPIPSGTISVTAPTDGAQASSCNPNPLNPVAGQYFDVSLGMVNSSTTNWTAGNYILSLLSPGWTSVSGNDLSSTVSAGIGHIFSVHLKAPAEGSYPFIWQMKNLTTNKLFGDTNNLCQTGGAVVVKPIGFTLSKSNDLIADLDSRETGSRNSSTVKITVNPLAGFSGSYVDFTVPGGTPVGTGTFLQTRLTSGQFATGATFYVTNVPNSSAQSTKTITIKGTSNNGATATVDVNLKIINSGYSNK